MLLLALTLAASDAKYAPPLHPAIGEVRAVDATGAVTSVRVRPTGAVVIAADAGAPAGVVLAEIAALPAPRYVAPYVVILEDIRQVAPSWPAAEKRSKRADRR